jgi:hypothetical protein
MRWTNGSPHDTEKMLQRNTQLTPALKQARQVMDKK